MQHESGDIIISFVVARDSKCSANVCVDELKNFDKIDITASEHKSKRSLAQNNMLWALCEKIAMATCGVKWKTEVEDCYCDLIEEVNVDRKFVVGQPEDRKNLEKTYRVVKDCGRRLIVDSNTNKQTEATLFCCYLGSHTFNTKQMTTLIDLALTRCADLGIYDSEIQSIMDDERR